MKGVLLLSVLAFSAGAIAPHLGAAPLSSMAWLAIGLLLLLWVEFRLARAENASLRRQVESAEWNLAGCELVAKGEADPFAYNREMARPALNAVSRLVKRRGSL